MGIAVGEKRVRKWIYNCDPMKWKESDTDVFITFRCMRLRYYACIDGECVGLISIITIELRVNMSVLMLHFPLSFIAAAFDFSKPKPKPNPISSVKLLSFCYC